MTERLGLNARIVTPEEKAAEKWSKRNCKCRAEVEAFLAGIEWQKKVTQK